MPKKSESEYKIYMFVCQNPGLCTYEISKKLMMSGGKVRYFLSKLEKKGLVKFKFDRKNPRIKKLSYPVSTLELLPKKIKILFKNLKV
ncbi:MAG: ArsR family transcriptional regulator [Candidatus Aenigmarchaeota archaeon]|nr:ArsR family transcriptional regulator [Candidatus Aenigmarchaeota archaeon]